MNFPVFFSIKNVMLALWVVCFFSCTTVTKSYQPPVAKTDSLYRIPMDSTDTATIAALSWQEIYTDTKLQALIQKAIDNNLDLKTAYSKIRETEAYYDQSRLNFYPDLNANASATVGKTISTTTNLRSNVHQYQLTLASTWQADIWGQLKNTQQANLAALLSSKANAKAVQTRLVASVANQYYILMGYDWQLRIMEQTRDTWRRTVEVMKILKKGDVVTGAAVVQSQASLYATEVSIPDIQKLRREAENSICNLLSIPSDSIPRDSLNGNHPIPAINVGLPAQLLSNRPDVAIAENDFRQAYALTNVARTNFYPQLSITASGGLSRNKLENYFSASSLIGTIVGNLTQPIFNKGINKMNLTVAQEKQNQAYYAYENTLLSAGQEVSNALFAYLTALAKIEPRKNQLDNLNKSVDYSQELVKNGFANYSEVLIAMQSLLSAQLSQVNDYLQKYQSVTNLYVALGGGWK
ncbi:MAG: efflux transporter outer membrane subunit [Chitinophagaceae bacterium]